MQTKSPHAAALDRIGRPAIMAHFHISKQAVSQWAQKGVPRIHLNSLRLLAMVRGVSVPELNEIEEKDNG